MKKLIAVLLALTMLVPMAFVSCSDDSKNGPGGLPIGDDSDEESVANSDGGDSEEDNKQQDEKIYEPDPDAMFSGSFALELSGAAYVDDIKVTSVKGKIVLVDDNFEETENLDAYTFKTANGGTWGGNSADWTIETIETIENEGKETETTVTNGAVKFAGEGNGAMICFGENDWNMVQASMKLSLSEGTSAKFYFGITDENNYYALNVGEKLYVEHCEGGKTTVDTIEIPYEVTYDEFFPISLVENANFVKCFVSGTQYFEAYKETSDEAIYGGIGFGTWSTQYSIDNIKVTSNSTGDVIYENDFENETLSDSVWQSFVAADGAWATVSDGGDWHDDWIITKEEDDHGNVLQVIGSITGGGIMLTESVGNSEWTDYTFEFDARKDGGAEGFMPYFAVTDVADPSKADYIRWNQGGWTNTLSCYQKCVEGSLTNDTQVSDSYTTGQWYHVSIQIVENYIIGMVDGKLINLKIN